MPQTIIFPEQDVSGFAYNNAFGCYFATMPQVSEPLVIGETYRVCWDDAEHELTAFAAAFGGTEAVAVGDKIITGAASTGEKFAIAHNPSTGYMNFFALDQKTTHRVAIYQGEEEHETLIGTGTELLVYSGTMTAIANAIRAKTGKTVPIPVPDMPAEIMGITTGGSSSEDVRYVTFMSYDGQTEYGKKAVAVGDDCADPIARGIFATPTRESTAQYNYTFAGWATEVNGGLDANALKAVTEDRRVYANFAAVTRYYTITYYDGDTVLKTESLAYGSMPAYKPEKDGYSFDGWNPALATVTGDAVYVAQWLEKITFADGTWADIVRIANEGDAQRHFAIGDTRAFSFTAPDGATVSTTLKIVAFDADSLSDGSKAAITIMAMTAPLVGAQMVSGDTYQWSSSLLRTELSQNILPCFPEELRNGIKMVSKTTRAYSTSGSTTNTVRTFDRLWIPSLLEYGYTANQPNFGVYPEVEIEMRYPGVSVKTILDVFADTFGDNGNGYVLFRSGNATSKYGSICFNGAGGVYRFSNSGGYARNYGFGFCI